MDSINREQPEENIDHLDGQEAGKKIRELADKASTCFFCTRITSDGAFKTRPMSVQKSDENGNFWFLSANDSHKNAEIAEDNRVQLLFQGSSYSDFLTVYGQANISTDRKLIEELWEPIVKVWFTEGIDDPRITVIHVQAQEGYYWDTKHNRGIALAKMMVGMVTGKTLDDSIEGNLTV